MEASKETGAGKESDNKVYEEEAETNIFSFKALQIDDSINPEKRSTADYEDRNLKQAGANNTWNFKSQTNMNPRRKIVDSSKRLKETFVDKEETESLNGNWSLFCNPNPDSNGHSEAITILKSAQELHNSRPDLFPIPPYSTRKLNGSVVVFCYTSDYTDKDLNLKAARVIREEIHYPFVMYYHKRIGNLTSFYMHTPDDEFYVNIEGRWILEEHLS